jgi:hypothetical protein
MNELRGTIVLPFSQKQGVNQEWVKTFQNNHGLFPGEWKLIMYDTTETMVSQTVGPLLRAMGWGEFHTIVKKNMLNLAGKSNMPFYLNMGSAIAHVWNNTREHIEGDLVVMIEDDILIPTGGIEALIYQLHQFPQCGIVGAVQRHKPEEMDPKSMLAWINKKPVTDDDFKHDSPLIVGSVATGMVVTYADLYKVADMSVMTYEYHASQDIAYCLMLKQLYGLVTMVDPTVEVVHMTKNHKKRGNFKSTLRSYYVESPKYEKTAPNQYKPVINTSPIFVCGFSGRSGTTWIQRIIMSHPNIMMYGEPQGAFHVLFDAADRMFNVAHAGVVMNSRERYNEFKAGGFIPNLGPMFANRINKVRRAFMKAFYGQNTETWGVKTINLNPTQIIQLFRSFPEARFIFVTRDLDKLKPSFEKVADRWWGSTWEDQVKHIDTMKHFTENLLPVDMIHWTLNHSNYSDQPEQMCIRLENLLDLGRETLSRDVAQLRLSFTDDDNQVLL